MEVSHVNTLDTHAIIGGGRIRQLKTLQNADFYEMLSTTLYQFKKLAPIREIMCNGWDANIMGGTTHKPLIVNITNSEVRIRDFGPGVPDDKFDDIYGTYGGSTKKKDASQTGGFGLGSKSPFAYAKNFSVISVHKGRKTVYNISRGTAATQGVPDIRVMVEVDTTEHSGVTVAFPMNPADRDEFINLVKAVGKFGGMKVRLNGRTVPRIKYEDVPADQPFILVPKSQIPEHLQQGKHDMDYLIKFGSVVYPVPTSFTSKKKIQILWDESQTHNMNFSDYAVVFLAPPNTIGVMPNRETIELTDKTIQTLEDLTERSTQMITDWKDLIVNAMMPYINNHAGKLENVLSALVDSQLDSLIQNPKAAFAVIAKNVIRNIPRIDTRSDIMLKKESIITLLARTALNAGVGVFPAAHRMSEDDPKAENIIRSLKKNIYRRYPLFPELLIKKIMKEGQSFPLAFKEYQYRVARDLFRILSNIEEKGGRCITRTGTHRFLDAPTADWGKFTSSKVFSEISTYAHRGRKVEVLAGSRSSIFEAIHSSKFKDVRDIPVILSNSDAAYQRFKRNTKEKNEHLIQGVQIIIFARKKKEYEKLKKHLFEVLRFTNVYHTDDPKYLPEPEKEPERISFPVLRGFNRNRRDNVVQVNDGQPITHYMFSTRTYHIEGGHKDLVQRKMNLNDEYLENISCMYPNIALVTSPSQAYQLERSGIKNVFKDMAEEAKLWLTAPENYETALSITSELAVFHPTYQYGQLMGIMTTRDIMEGLGQNPTYAEPKVMPIVVSTFLSLLHSSGPPKYGFQYLRKAAGEINEIFKAQFSGEVSRVIRNPMIKTFLEHMPSIGNITQDERIIFRAAFLSAFQVARLHTKLKESSS